MENLKYNEETYDRIFVKDNNFLIKYSMIPKEVWMSLLSKNIDFINNPLKIAKLKEQELKYFPNYKSKILLPFLNGYETLTKEQFTKNFNTEDILKQLRDILLKIRSMHRKQVFHTDLFGDNIMINRDFDIKFIDLDQMIIDKYISEENVFFEDDITFNEKKSLSRIQDKVDILNLYMYYLINGNFKKSISINSNVNTLDIPNNIKKEINAYIIGDIEPTSNYYFIDIIDELLKIGYESRVLSLRKGI